MNENDLRDAFRSAIAVSEPPPAMNVATATRAGRRRLRRRNTLVGLGSAMTAVAIAVAVGAVPGPRGATPPPPATGSTDRTDPSDGDAQRIVRAATAALRRTTEPAPRPDQFVYRRTVDSYGNPPKVREIWLSVDGTADGLLKERPQNPGDPSRAPHLTPEAMLPGCRGGQIGIEISNNRPTKYVPCTPTPHYRTDLPTGGSDMLAYLMARMDTNNPDDRSRRLDPLRDLFVSYDVPAAATAAIFEAAARIPDLYLRSGIVEGGGRAAVAIGVNSTDTIRGELLFDASTYRYIGSRTVETTTVDDLRTDSVTTYSTVLAQGFVDRTGQLP